MHGLCNIKLKQPFSILVGETSEKRFSACIQLHDRKRFQNITTVHACSRLNEATIYYTIYCFYVILF